MIMQIAISKVSKNNAIDNYRISIKENLRVITILQLQL